MNKRGFTLVELLGVIVIIAVVLSIVFPTVSSILNKGKDTVDNVQTNKILNGAYDYSLKKISLLPNEGKTTYITLNELKKYGYVDSDIIDPNTNEVYPNDIVVSIKNVGPNYNNKSSDSMLQGNYLYKMIKNSGSSCEPVISFNNPQELVNIDIGATYTETSYTAEDCNGNDITDKVVKNIVKDNKNTDKIDSYESGIYTIDYCVVDSSGNVGCKIVSVVVKDVTTPILTIPSSVSIGTTVTKYDLMEGVSCTDNSKKCEIDVEGNIEFGVAGKYVIEYKASDPAGNTTVEKRVITIK